MPFVTSTFFACCRATVETDAVTLPLSDEKLAEISKLLEAEDAYTFAAIRSESTYETVKLYLSAGSLVMDRAQEGTTAVKHPCGAFVCLPSPTTVAAIKALICEYDCCEDHDCECQAVTFSGSFLPKATLNTEWEGAVVFTGEQPMVFGLDNQPHWMSATTQGNVIKLSGTPDSRGMYSFSVAASNCNGTKVATRVLSLTVE